MRQCPKCGYRDSPYWRPRIFDYEIDICRLDDLQHFMPELATRLKPGLTVEEDIFAYKVTRSKVVYRMELDLWRVRGWSPKGPYYDGLGSPFSKNYKRAVSHEARVAKTQGKLVVYQHKGLEKE